MRVPRSRQAAYLVPRRTITVVVAVSLIALVGSIAFVWRAHGEGLPIDSRNLELAAAILALLVVLWATIPLRLRLLNRRLERTLTRLETGTAAVGDNPLGTLGEAFQEHYRLLWRTSALQQGTIAVQRLLVENLTRTIESSLVVLDGQGRVRYSSAAAVAAGLGEPGDLLAVSVKPSLPEIIATLSHGEAVDTVTLDGTTYHCYGVFGPVLLGRGDGNKLEPREGLAYLVLTDTPIENPRTRVVPKYPRQRSGRDSWFSRAQRALGLRR